MDNNSLQIYNVAIIETEDPELEDASLASGIKSIKESILRSQNIGMEKLQGQMKEFITKMNTLLQSCALDESSYKIDTVEIHAEISAEGQIGLLGTSASISGSGGIKFVFKKKEI